jgi:hypothetical protein
MPVRLAALLCACALVIAACGGDDDDSSAPEPVSVDGKEYAFVMPDKIDGGFVTMDFTNSGEELHEYGLARLDEGVSEADVDKAIASGEEPKGLEDIGGVPVLSPGTEVSVARDLEPGRYVFVCFLPDPKGRPHVALGMKKVFTVEGDQDAEPPDVDGVIEAKQKNFEVPPIEAGEQTIELRNSASKPREFSLAGLRPGHTIQEASNFVAPLEKGRGFKVPADAPLEFLGAMQSIPPGTSVYFTAEFQSGWRYRIADEENGLEQIFKVQ